MWLFDVYAYLPTRCLHRLGLVCFMWLVLRWVLCLMRWEGGRQMEFSWLWVKANGGLMPRFGVCYLSTTRCRGVV